MKTSLFRAQRRIRTAALLGLLLANHPALAGDPAAHMDDPDRAAGDIFQMAIPAIGLGAALYRGDTEGMKDWAYTMGGTMAAVQALKYGLNDTPLGERPNGGQHSFPSGHSAGACAGAAFIGRRYGWGYGAVAYIPAAFTGWSRVDENLHHWRDVIAGCALATGIAWYMVDPEKPGPSLVIYPDVSGHSVSLGFFKRF